LAVRAGERQIEGSRRETHAAVRDLPFIGVAALATSAPNEPYLATLDGMLADLSALRWLEIAAIWLDEFDEYRASAPVISRLARLVSSWRHLSLVNLYGGCLSLLLHHFGRAGVSSGVTYGRSRSTLRMPAVAPAALRPNVARRSSSASAAGSLPVRRLPGWADGVAVAHLKPHRLRLHFALARDAEGSHVASQSLRTLVAELREAEQLVETVAARAPARSAIREVPPSRRLGRRFGVRRLLILATTAFRLQARRHGPAPEWRLPSGRTKGGRISAAKFLSSETARRRPSRTGCLFAVRKGGPGVDDVVELGLGISFGGPQGTPYGPRPSAGRVAAR
jgi:hypothetical protein